MTTGVPPNSGRLHPPLSEDLARLMEPRALAQAHSLNSLLLQTQGRGIHLVVILLALPFITPIPLPGLSSLFGVVILILGVRLALELPPRLPRWLGERALSLQKWQRVLQASLKTVRFIEKLARPRGRLWITLRPARIGNGLIIAYLGLLLIIPFPPFVFFTNSLPSYALILIAASMMEEDGVLVWYGYATTLLATAYFGLLFFGGFKLVIRYSEVALEWLRSLL